MTCWHDRQRLVAHSPGGRQGAPQGGLPNRHRIAATLTLSLVLFLLCLWAFPAALGAEGEAPAEVRAAAQRGLFEFLASLPRAALADFGFNEASELNLARLGKAYQVHVLTPDGLQSAVARRAVGPFLQPTQQWIFPVLVGDQPRTLLWVDRMPEGYRAVQLGNAVLAKSLGQWEAQLPRLLDQQGIVGQRCQLVQMPQLLSDLLVVRTTSGEYIAPLHVAPELSAMLSSDRLSRVDKALPMLQGALNELPGQADDAHPAGGGTSAGKPASRPSVAPLVLLVLSFSTASAVLWRRGRAPNEPSS